MDAAPPDPPAPLDPVALLRSRQFLVLLVFAAVVGLVVSFASWAFLELVNQIQGSIFTDLPDAFGYDTMPTWWPLPVLAVAGVPVAFATARLPGAGGHIPAHGLAGGATTAAMVPGVVLAGLASLGFGVVLGPEGPLVAVGTGLALFAMARAKPDAPAQVQAVLGAAGSLAAISVVFGSPLVATVLVIEIAGVGGAMMPVLLLPGLVAAGTGSLLFIGLAGWTGLDTSAYALVPLNLAAFDRPTGAEIAWSALIGVVAALVTFGIRQIGLAVVPLVARGPFIVVPVAGLAIAGLAIAFGQATDEPVSEVLFSGQEALPGLVDHTAEWSTGTLAMLLVCKGLAWAIALGSFRGGPTFPAIFLGAAGGILATHLPGLGTTAAVAVGVGAMCVAILRLPLSSILIATVLTASAGLGTGPIIILGVVVAYLVTLALDGVLERRRAPVPEPHPAADAVASTR